MKKEITGWTTMGDIEDFLDDNCALCVYTKTDMSGAIKVTITYEVDRKVSISESEFDKVWYESAAAETKAVHESYLNLKQRLFGESEEV